MRDEVARARAGLVELGVGRGDRVAGYLPNIPEALIAFLATASLGAIWSSCSPDFGAPAIIDRFTQIQPKVLIAVDGYTYNGRYFDRTGVVADIAARLPSLNATVRVPEWELLRQAGRPHLRPGPLRPPALDPLLLRHDRRSRSPSSTATAASSWST